MKFADTLADLLDAPTLALRAGTVTATAGATLSVNLAGAVLDSIPRLTSYTPQVGDVAILLQSGSQLLAIGRAA